MIKHLGRRTILVIGATGTVGSEVVKQLVSSSSDQNVIRAVVHSQDKAEKFKQYKTVETVNMDYNNSETIAAALNQVDKLFLLTLPTLNVIEIYSNLVKQIRKYGGGGINHIVKLSSMEAETGPETTIGRLHRQEEKIIEESGIPYTFLRPSAFMQNFVNYLGQTIRNQNAFYLPTGDGKVSFVDVRDIAAVSVRVLTSDNGHAGKAYTITGQEAISHGQAAEILSNEVGKRISYTDIPKEYARKGMKEIGMDDWFIDVMIESYGMIKAGNASRTTTVVEQITGRKPISFTQFARDYVKFFK
jgi:uncharacterized protein YbjT (DUF2867 family)